MRIESIDNARNRFYLSNIDEVSNTLHDTSNKIICTNELTLDECIFFNTIIKEHSTAPKELKQDLIQGYVSQAGIFIDVLIDTLLRTESSYWAGVYYPDYITERDREGNQMFLKFCTLIPQSREIVEQVDKLNAGSTEFLALRDFTKKNYPNIVIDKTPLLKEIKKEVLDIYEETLKEILIKPNEKTQEIERIPEWVKKLIDDCIIDIDGKTVITNNLDKVAIAIGEQGKSVTKEILKRFIKKDGKPYSSSSLTQALCAVNLGNSSKKTTKKL
jgi:hypothetical protein